MLKLPWLQQALWEPRAAKKNESMLEVASATAGPVGTHSKYQNVTVQPVLFFV